MLAIRDDDTSFWTSREEIQSLYGELLNKGFKISLAVIPYAHALFYPGDRSKFYLSDEKGYIYDNRDLVEYLTPYVKSGQVEIMQHGYSHSYCVKNAEGGYSLLNATSRKKIGNSVPEQLYPECIYKGAKELRNEIQSGKEILEDTFHTRVATFVPPSNAITAKGIEIVAQNGMNISGTMTNHFNRKFDRWSLCVFVRKMIWKAGKHKGSYPYIMRYKDHTELVGHSFTPSMNYDRFCLAYEESVRLGCDFTLATHYWEVLENLELEKLFYDFLLKKQGNKTSCLKDLLKGGR